MFRLLKHLSENALFLADLCAAVLASRPRPAEDLLRPARSHPARPAFGTRDGRPTPGGSLWFR